MRFEESEPDADTEAPDADTESAEPEEEAEPPSAGGRSSGGGSHWRTRRKPARHRLRFH